MFWLPAISRHAIEPEVNPWRGKERMKEKERKKEVKHAKYLLLVVLVLSTYLSKSFLSFQFSWEKERDKESFFGKWKERKELKRESWQESRKRKEVFFVWIEKRCYQKHFLKRKKKKKEKEKDFLFVDFRLLCRDIYLWKLFWILRG